MIQHALLFMLVLNRHYIGQVSLGSVIDKLNGPIFLIHEGFLNRVSLPTSSMPGVKPKANHFQF